MTVQESSGTKATFDPVELSHVGMVMLADMLDEIDDPSQPTEQTEESLRELIEIFQETATAIATMCEEASLDSRKSLRKIRNLLEFPHGAESSTMAAATIASRWERFNSGLTKCVEAARSIAKNDETEKDKHQASSFAAGSSCSENSVLYSDLLYACDRVLKAQTRLLVKLTVL